MGSEKIGDFSNFEFNEPLLEESDDYAGHPYKCIYFRDWNYSSSNGFFIVMDSEQDIERLESSLSED